MRNYLMHATLTTGWCGEDSEEFFTFLCSDPQKACDCDNELHEYSQEVAQQNAEQYGSADNACDACEGEGCEECEGEGTSPNQDVNYYVIPLGDDYIESLPSNQNQPIMLDDKGYYLEKEWN